MIIKIIWFLTWEKFWNEKNVEYQKLGNYRQFITIN
jgi:hypothetical protein